MSESSGRGAIVTTIVLFAVLLAVANAVGFTVHAQSLGDPSFSLAGAGFTERLTYAWTGIYAKHAGFVWFFLATPLLVVGFIAMLVALRLAPNTGSVQPRGDQDEDATPLAQNAALHLLALLQQEGRFIDFVEEDIEPYSDEQVGAAVRAIHSGCRSALHERMEIARIYEEADGTELDVDPDYDPNLVRLTGNVHGEPPFHGTLEHGGWRVSNVRLPERIDVDVTVLAPAEIEVS
jgi:hypothetical protein